MQLSHKNLPLITDKANRPSPKVQKAKIGILHLGLGNFYRAHQCAFTQDTIEATGQDWAYVVANMSHKPVADHLKKQDYLYTLVSKSLKEHKAQIINVIKDIIVLNSEKERFYDYLSDDSLNIVTMTITEKGYYFEPSTGHLLIRHPDIQYDLQNPTQPKTVIGLLVNALKQRRDKLGKGLSILSCDNLPHNGRIAKKVILDYAHAHDKTLALWIAKHVAFPSSMVDRITPFVTEKQVETFTKDYGYSDEIPIFTESFRQWIIEDNFPYGRPLWEVAGAELVSDVTAFEEMKLRLLNGTHSAMAYLGYLSGFPTIDTFIDVPANEKFIRDMMDKEITPSLNLPKNVNLEQYKNALITRYKNPYLKHKTYQIAMDGSQKIPQRIINSLAYQYEKKGQYSHLLASLSGWLYYIQGYTENGQAIEIQDPMIEKLKSLYHLSHDAFIHKILSDSEIFGSFFADKTELIKKIIMQNEMMREMGILSYIRYINKL